jgi:predicted negative regulator of RcsB-dependent stress response
MPEETSGARPEQPADPRGRRADGNDRERRRPRYRTGGRFDDGYRGVASGRGDADGTADRGGTRGDGRSTPARRQNRRVAAEPADELRERRELRRRQDKRSQQDRGHTPHLDVPHGPNWVDKEIYDGPPLSDLITGRELDRQVRAQLRALPEKLATRVARHLVAAAQALDTDPDLAYQHTLAARARAARVPVVREAAGEAAYASGRFREALQEFKAARRIGGDHAYLPMMADCERALGRPARAITMSKDDVVEQLDDAGKAEMLIVAAGARRDLGQIDAAIRTLEGPRLTSRIRAPWVARMRYAYADLLLTAHRTDEAREWFERALGVDHDHLTDAADRIAELDEQRSSGTT